MNLDTLITTSEDNRDAKWETLFLSEFPNSNITLIDPQPKVGADGFPYLFAKTEAQAKEPVLNVFHWLSTKGLGLVVNPQKKIPDYIFTYGMIWYFRETGRFYGNPPQESSSKLELEEGMSVFAGPPSESYLPAYVRTALKQFLNVQEIKEPKILVLSKDRLNYDLCFSLDSLGHPPEHEHAELAEVLSWFLPPHYSLVLIKEEGLPKFTDL
jgi:hypothetical protein